MQTIIAAIGAIPSREKVQTSYKIQVWHSDISFWIILYSENKAW